MDWFVFALLSAVMFSCCNIVDKFVLTKKIRNPFSYNILSVALSILPVLLLVFYLKLSFDSSAIIAVLYGFAYVFLFIIYNKAMIEEEASRVVSIIRISPIFVLILSFVFLSEVLNYQKYLGIIFLVSSAVLVSYRGSKKKFHISKGIALILLYSFGGACLGIILKYTLGYTDYWAFFFWNLIGNMIGCFALILPATIRKNLIENVSKIDIKTWLIVLSSDVFLWSGYLLYFLATSIGRVSLVSAAGAIQPMIVFILTLILTIHRPKILKEEIGKMSLTFKTLAVIFIIIGSYLIVT
jgi:uncharacterized membrane protein